MYGNLLIEMKKRKVTQAEIAEALNISRRSVFNKVSGNIEFSMSEALTIKRTFFNDKTIEYLFEQK